ncbi:alpha/beta hydrolase [soil metagenome]
MPASTGASADPASPSAPLPAGGELVDIGGRSLYLECTGEGTPVVVMEAGVGSASSSWSPVIEALADVTRVCVYDRANLGRSDPASTPRSGADVVDDLEALLGAAELPPPYALVGHSLGGLLVSQYAARDPGRVSGLVLVDSVHPDLFDRYSALIPPERLDQIRARLGSNPEGLALEATLREAQAESRVPPVLTVVVAATEGHGLFGVDTEAAETLWAELQQELADASPAGRLVVATGSGHSVQADQPEVVIAAVRDVVEQVRSQP